MCVCVHACMHACMHADTHAHIPVSETLQTSLCEVPCQLKSLLADSYTRGKKGQLIHLIYRSLQCSCIYQVITVLRTTLQLNKYGGGGKQREHIWLESGTYHWWLAPLHDFKSTWHHWGARKLHQTWCLPTVSTQVLEDVFKMRPACFYFRIRAWDAVPTVSGTKHDTGASQLYIIMDAGAPRRGHQWPLQALLHA